MAPFEQGGVENEDATELAGFGGVGPDGGLWVQDSLPTNPVAIPEPIFVTIIDPATTRAITVAVPFAKSITVAHTGPGSISISDSDAFPPAAEPLPSPGESEP